MRNRLWSKFPDEWVKKHAWSWSAELGCHRNGEFGRLQGTDWRRIFVFTFRACFFFRVLRLGYRLIAWFPWFDIFPMAFDGLIDWVTCFCIIDRLIDWLTQFVRNSFVIFLAMKWATRPSSTGFFCGPGWRALASKKTSSHHLTCFRMFCHCVRLEIGS